MSEIKVNCEQIKISADSVSEAKEGLGYDKGDMKKLLSSCSGNVYNSLAGEESVNSNTSSVNDRFLAFVDSMSEFLKTASMSFQSADASNADKIKN